MDGIHPIQKHISLYTQTLVQFGWDSKVYRGWDIRFDSWQRYFFPDFTYTPFPVSIYNPAHPTPLNAGVKSEWSTQHIETSCSGHSNKCFVTAQYVTSIVITTVKNTAYLYVNRTTCFQNFKNVWRSVFSVTTTAYTLFILQLFFSFSLTRTRWRCHCTSDYSPLLWKVAGVRSQATPCWICVKQIGNTTGFSPSTPFFPPPISLHKCSMHTFICYWRYAMLTTDSDTK